MPAQSNITRLRVSEKKESTAFESCVNGHLERVLQSPHFDASARSRDFLRFVIGEALAGRGARLNQAAIAVAVFGRKGDFDAILDPIVRVQAGRLRRSLERYYLLAGSDDSIRIELTKGSYAPAFVAKQSARSSAPTYQPSAVAAADWPVVVVHPFEACVGQDITASVRIVDELTTELHRYGQMRVVRQCDLERLGLPQPSRFELRGSVRSDGQDCAIGARLVDRTTAEQFWSDEYRVSLAGGCWPGSIDDVARIVAARVGAEQGVIVRMLIREHRARRDDASGAYDAVMRSHDFFLSRHHGELLPTIDAVRQAAAHEPQLPTLWSCLARLYLLNHSLELSDVETPVESAIACIDQAALLDPASVRLRCILASALLVKGELQAARHELAQAQQLNGNALAHRETIGWLTALAGDWDRGAALMRDAVRRNPYCLPHVQHGLWADHMRSGQFEDAYVAALEYQDCGLFWRALMKAASLGLLGRLREARPHVAELLQAKPQFAQRGRTLIGHYIKSPELIERIVIGLGRAGLPVSDEPQV
jgi:adenylate cyclase